MKCTSCDTQLSRPNILFQLRKFSRHRSYSLRSCKWSCNSTCCLWRIQRQNNRRNSFRHELIPWNGQFESCVSIFKLNVFQFSNLLTLGLDLAENCPYSFGCSTNLLRWLTISSSQWNDSLWPFAILHVHWSLWLRDFVPNMQILLKPKGKAGNLLVSM